MRSLMNFAPTKGMEPKADTIALYKRYWGVKQALGRRYESHLTPYRVLLLRRMDIDEVVNPLLAGARLVQSLNLCPVKNRDTTDLILCAAVEAALSLSLSNLAGRVCDTLIESGKEVH